MAIIKELLDYDPRLVFLLLLGLGIIAAVAVEKFVKKIPLSLPVVYVLIGNLIFLLPLDFPKFSPIESDFDNKIVEYTTEFLVIISLMSAGIAIDRKFRWKTWKEIWPFLVILMPASIIAVAVSGYFALGLSVAAAILLGACISPTDPVLADSVQVLPPGHGEGNSARFSLTLEAGLNDGLAFPFVYLAIAAIGMTSLGDWTWHWFGLDLIGRVTIGLAIGYGAGLAISHYIFKIEDHEKASMDEPRGARIACTNEGLIILGAVLFSYGLTEIFYGYGFLAVFVAAVTIRQKEISHGYKIASHHFIEQVERIVLIFMLIGVGALLAGGALKALTWQGTLLALAIVFVIRPLLGLLVLIRCPVPFKTRFAMSFLGIRGIGSLYYLSYGQAKGDFGGLEQLWAVVGLTILLSIVVHGSSAKYLMDQVDILEDADTKAHPLQKAA